MTNILQLTNKIILWSALVLAVFLFSVFVFNPNILINMLPRVSGASSPYVPPSNSQIKEIKDGNISWYLSGEENLAQTNALSVH